MFKRIGISLALLAGLVAFAAPKPADAKVHIGVYLGARPVYTAPAYPAYGYNSYVDPYATPYVDPYVDPYAYPAPVYVAPYSYGGRYYRNYDHERHERMELEQHEMRDHSRGWRRKVQSRAR